HDGVLARDAHAARAERVLRRALDARRGDFAQIGGAQAIRVEAALAEDRQEDFARAAGEEDVRHRAPDLRDDRAIGARHRIRDERLAPEAAPYDAAALVVDEPTENGEVRDVCRVPRQ